MEDGGERVVVVVVGLDHTRRLSWQMFGGGQTFTDTKKRISAEDSNRKRKTMVAAMKAQT